MSLKEKLEQLKAVCSLRERQLIEEMIISAADYVRQVTVMEITAFNVVGREQEELREAVKTEDSSRTNCHNALITRVDVVNRICTNHGVPLMYTGDTQRRHYGDFAGKLVTEVFENRK